MTTIIVDSRVGVMGADRRQVSNDSDIVMQGACKINKIELDDGIHLVACSGHESPAAIFLEWYEWGDDDKPLDALELNEDEDEGFEGVVLTPQADILIADRFMVPYKIPDRFYGSGTGGPYAWSVLKAGCGIEKALKTAISLDPFSGEGYDIVSLHDVDDIEG